MSEYDYNDETGLSAAELELINEAEKDLSKAGVKVADVDPDKDISDLAKDELKEIYDSIKPVTLVKSTNEGVEMHPIVEKAYAPKTETAEAATKTAKTDVETGYYKWNVVDEDGVVVSSHRTRAQARDARLGLPGCRVKKIEESSGVTILESPKTEVITIPAKIFDVEDAAPPADAKIVVTPKAESKKARCIRIYNECNADGPVKRAVVLKRFMEEVGLSKPGASTYYANIKLRKDGWT